MIVNVYVPCDAAALSVGADDVANAILKHSKGKVNIIRNGSRGMLWLEPLVEVETPKGRVAYGPVSVEDINSLFASNFLEGGDHPLLNGITEEIPYFANQERLTFAQLEYLQAHQQFANAIINLRYETGTLLVSKNGVTGITKDLFYTILK